MKKNLRNTSLNTSRLALTQKTWKKCTPSVMPPSVQIQHLNPRNKSKSTRRDGTEPESPTLKDTPRRTSQSFIPSCPSRRGGISVRTCFAISLYGSLFFCTIWDIKTW